MKNKKQKKHLRIIIDECGEIPPAKDIQCALEEHRELMKGVRLLPSKPIRFYFGTMPWYILIIGITFASCGSQTKESPEEQKQEMNEVFLPGHITDKSDSLLRAQTLDVLIGTGMSKQEAEHALDSIALEEKLKYMAK